jgi:hypothetical protein
LNICPEIRPLKPKKGLNGAPAYGLGWQNQESTPIEPLSP